MRTISRFIVAKEASPLSYIFHRYLFRFHLRSQAGPQVHYLPRSGDLLLMDQRGYSSRVAGDQRWSLATRLIRPR